LENTPQAEKELFKELLPSDVKKGIEIGVLNGETSGFFLNTFPDLHLTGVDPLIPDSMEPSLIGDKDKIIGNVRLHLDRFTFIKDYSYNVFPNFPVHSFDFIFIDGSHLYEDVRKDYLLYYHIVKEGGLIFLHDSRMNRGGANFHPGPSRLADLLIKGDLGGIFDRLETLITPVELVGEAFSLTAFRK